MNLEETILVIFAVALTILNSCESIPTDRCGLDVPVGPGATGSSAVEVDFTVAALRLTGSISVTGGTVMAEVMSPSGAALFSVSVDAPGELRINRTLPAEVGEWRLRYLSPDGTGYIRIHLELIR